MTPIDPLSSALNSLQKVGATNRSNNANGFGDAIAGALAKISQQQNAAGALQNKFQMEDSSVSLEDTMLAMNKAQIGFQAALQVRNRVVQAYTDIMNMPV